MNNNCYSNIGLCSNSNHFQQYSNDHSRNFNLQIFYR